MFFFTADSGGFAGSWAACERVGQEKVGERRLAFPLFTPGPQVIDQHRPS